MKAVYAKQTEKAMIHMIQALQGKVMVMPTLALADALKDMDIQLNDRIATLSHVKTTAMLADGMTKSMCVSAIRALLRPPTTST